MGRTFCWNGDRRSLSAGGTAAPLSCDLIGRSRSLAEYERCTIQLNSTQQFQFSASFKSFVVKELKKQDKEGSAV
ncbi:hypothetical protein TNCV_4000191 [Trichonephila clavipes]|nr:hypothetical protein TNCV_4000191 [Trichonephila clavipes]